MGDDAGTSLLPVLGRSLDMGFNVFDVMHHGTHGEQLSNVFRQIFEIGGTHNFESLRLCIDLINEELVARELGGFPLPAGPYSVRQVITTAPQGEVG